MPKYCIETNFKQPVLEAATNLFCGQMQGLEAVMLKVQIAISVSPKIQKMLSVKSNTPSLLAPCSPQCPRFLHGPLVVNLGMDQVSAGAMLA